MYSILIVDDDPWMVEYLVKCIPWEHAGIEEVHEAGSGEEALEALKKFPINIVISDVKMGAKDGIGLLKDIDSIYPYIKVILLSGIDSGTNVREAFRLGVVDFLFKPVDPEALKILVKKTITNIEKEKGENTIASYMKGIPVGTAYLPEWVVNKKKKRLYVFSKNAVPQKEKIQDFFKCQGNTAAGVLGNEFILIHEPVDGAKQDVYGICCSGEDTCVGISNEFMDIQEVKSAYAEAKDALDYKFYDKETDIFYYTDTQENEKMFCLIRNISLFSNMLMAEKYKEAEVLLKTVLEGMAVMKPPLTTVHTMLLRLIETLYAVIDKSNQNPRLVFCQEYSIQKHYEKLEFTDFCDMEAWLYNCFGHCVEALMNRGQNSKRKIIEDIEEIISMNLADDISLEKIALHLYLNPSYLSRLFKENVGKPYTRYLMEKRIEKARQLLREENYKIYEIGELVGYENTKYFNKIFKELAGITPKEYREKCKGL